MQIVRSALSCCVLDKLPCAIIRSLCGTRDVDIDWEKKSTSESSVILDIVDDLLEADAIDDE